MRPTNTPRTFFNTSVVRHAAGITPLSEARDPAPERRAPRRTVHTSPGGSSFTGLPDSDGRGPTRTQVASRYRLTRVVRVGCFGLCPRVGDGRFAGRVGVRPYSRRVVVLTLVVAP